MESIMAKRSCGASWIRLGFVRASIFWVLLAVLIPVAEGKQLDTLPKVTASCGEQVTLTCNASASLLKDVNVVKFNWQFKNTTLCQYESKDVNSDKIRCKSTNTTSGGLTLSMTILNIIPKDEGVYLCKLHTTGAAANGQSHVKVEDCVGSSDDSMDNNTARCSFDRVFPAGVVHWYQGDANLTKTSKTENIPAAEDFFKVVSEIPAKEASQSLNCSLWMPSTNIYVASRLVTSSGSISHLQWICMMVGIFMRSLIM
ncbi:uncharacterized protein LOC118560775 [Fundulus heteroclitus]|uniref:uncharacterized protein LOC118560775 n=1 Tax=Fundulus heteroclitus TaxID=8078 RepID=UPI00165BB36E|nr:uncharacterized protein LOC118560775 [Fundulus heteroclitus]